MMVRNLRSDLYRLAHGPTLRITLGIVVALALASLFMGVSAASSSPGVVEGSGMADSGHLDVTRAPASMLLMYSVVISCAASVFVSSDFEGGFDRTLLCVGAGRGGYVVAKLISVSIISVLAMAASSLVSALAWLPRGFPPSAQDVAGLAAWTVASWSVTCSYGLLAALATWLTHSRTAGVAWSLLVSSASAGMVLMYALTGLLQSLGVDAGPVDAALSWSLATSLSTLQVGVAALGLGGVGLAGMPVGLAAGLLVARIVGAGLVTVIVSLGVALGPVAHRDVR